MNLTCLLCRCRFDSKNLRKHFKEINNYFNYDSYIRKNNITADSRNIHLIETIDFKVFIMSLYSE